MDYFLGIPALLVVLWACLQTFYYGRNRTQRALEQAKAEREIVLQSHRRLREDMWRLEELFRSTRATQLRIDELLSEAVEEAVEPAQQTPPERNERSIELRKEPGRGPSS